MVHASVGVSAGGARSRVGVESYFPPFLLGLSVCLQLTISLCSERTIIKWNYYSAQSCRELSPVKPLPPFSGRGVKMEQVRIEQAKNPRDEAGFFSIVFFWWMNPLLALGYSRDLELEDLFEPRKEDGSEVDITDNEENY